MGFFKDVGKGTLESTQDWEVLVSTHSDRQWIKEQCLVANIRLMKWKESEKAGDCECLYVAPYGFVIAAGCRWHD